MSKKNMKHCKGCKHHWTHGVKDGKHDNWCCYHGRAAVKAYKHCINTGGKVSIKGSEM